MSDGNYTLERLEAEFEELQFSSFTFEDAWAVGTELVEAARKEALPVAIDITLNGQVLFHAGLPGSSPDNDQWLLRKARIVQRFHRSSLHMSAVLKSKGTSLEEKYGLSPADYAPYGGAVPIRIRGVGVVGCLAVSGLADHEDHGRAVSALRNRLGKRA